MLLNAMHKQVWTLKTEQDWEIRKLALSLKVAVLSSLSFQSLRLLSVLNLSGRWAKHLLKAKHLYTSYIVQAFIE